MPESTRMETESRKKPHRRIVQRKARRRYICTVCGREIEPGCQYIYESYEAEKYISSRRHIHCDAMVEAWTKKYGSETTEETFVPSVSPFKIAEDIQKHVCDKLCRYFDREQIGCGLNAVYSCTHCIKELLPPHLVRAALQSVRENQEG